VLLALGLLAACPGSPTPVAASESESGSTNAESESTDAGSESESGVDPALDVSVKWIEVAASDYKLELQPEFDAEITQYTALADGPDITVYIDVIVDADVDGILVNAVPAALVGFRTWRSAPETGLVSPAFAIVEILAPGAEVPVYSIDVIMP
jgi:hypothetical protein